MEFKAQQQLIENFVSSIQQIYPHINVGYAYDEDLEFYEVWHDSKVLQFEDNSFLEFVGCQIKEKLYSNNIFNVSFGYDHEKFKTETDISEYQIQKDTLVSYHGNLDIMGNVRRKFTNTYYSTTDRITSEKSLSFSTAFSKINNRSTDEKSLIYKGNQSFELDNTLQQLECINISQHQERTLVA